MTNIYQEEPGRNEDTGLGLVAGLVLVLAIIALVYLAARAVPMNGWLNNNAGVQIENSDSI